MIILLYIILIPLLTVLDQVIKELVIANLKGGNAFTVIPGLLEFKYLENTGAAFGIFQDMTWFFSLATAAIIVIVIVYLYKTKPVHPLVRTAAIMVISGGLGNLIDRIFRGYVVDFIHALFFDYIFNFADCLVVVGVIIFIIYTIFIMKDKEEGQEKKDDTDA